MAAEKHSPAEANICEAYVELDLLYSPADRQHLDQVKQCLRSLDQKSQTGLSLIYDVNRPLSPESILLIRIQNHQQDDDHILAKVVACHKLDEMHYQLALQLLDEELTSCELEQQVAINKGSGLPAQLSAVCPSCEGHSNFTYVGILQHDNVGKTPIYTCSSCGSTRSLPSIILKNNDKQRAEKA